MNFKRLAGTILTVVLALAVAPRSTYATEKTDVLAAVHQFFDNLDPDHLPQALAMCDSPVSIIDEIPPHEWFGPTACADWWKALNEYNDKNGITDLTGTRGTPWTIDVTGDRAYVVLPATETYKQNGKLVSEPHCVLTVALKLTPAGWRITAWAWSKH